MLSSNSSYFASMKRVCSCRSASQIPEKFESRANYLHSFV